MNVLIYTHHYPSPSEAGIPQDTKVVHYFAKMLMEKGHRVQVVHLFYWPVKEISLRHARFILPGKLDYEVEGVPVRLIRYQMLTPRRIYPEGFQAMLINRQLRQMKKQLGWQADKVFVHFPPAFTGLTEIFADGAPALGDFHNMDVTVLQQRDPGGKMLQFVRRLDHWGYRNKRVQEYLRDVCGGAPVPVYTGIDASLLGNTEEISSKKKQHSDVLRVVYAGQLIPLKHVDALIAAVKQMTIPVTLTIIGDGEERAKLEQQAAGDERIRFTGWLKREDVIREMKQADVFAMVSSPETYGMVYLEAMAQGCIPVAGRGEGFDGLIRDGENGFLVAPGNADEVRQVLEKLHTLQTAQSQTRERLMDAAYALACDMVEENTTEGFLRANAVVAPAEQMHNVNA